MYPDWSPFKLNFVASLHSSHVLVLVPVCDNLSGPVKIIQISTK